MARQSWELLDWPHLCRCLLFARPITFAAREIRTSGHLVETQSLDAACGGLLPDLLRVTPIGNAVPNKSGPQALASGGMRSRPGSLGRAREASFRFVMRPLRWKRDRSLASAPGSAELTSATTIRSTS